jgi:hypothetical protein
MLYFTFVNNNKNKVCYKQIMKLKLSESCWYV